MICAGLAVANASGGVSRNLAAMSAGDAPGMAAAPHAPAASSAKASRHQPVEPDTTRLGPWRDVASAVPIENLEGLVLLTARIRAAGHDTTGLFALDTGAGFVAIDDDLAQILGIAIHTESDQPIATTDLPVDRLEIGTLEFDQVQPVLTIDADIVRGVSQRPVLGLIGGRLLRSQTVILDYRAQEVILIPGSAPPPPHSPSDTLSDSRSDHSPGAAVRDSDDDSQARIAASRAALAGAFGKDAEAVPFRLMGDDKIVVNARVSNTATAMSDTLTLMLDTGATKTAFFEDALNAHASAYESWPAMRGLSAPTLIGASETRIARVRAIQLLGGRKPISVTNSDAAILDSPLESGLSNEVGTAIDGLLGYTFLRHFRVGIDYPHRVLWLEPIKTTQDDRPYEYSQVGIQLERHEDALQVVGVATDSPADRAGVRRGDVIVSIDGVPATSLDVVTASLRFEGPPGSRMILIARRGEQERTYRLVRKRLL